MTLNNMASKIMTFLLDCFLPTLQFFFLVHIMGMNQNFFFVISGPGGLTTMLKNLRNLRDASRTEGLSGGQISEDLTNEANPSTSNKYGG